MKFRRTRCSIKTGLYDEAGRVQGGFHQRCLVKERPQLNVEAVRMEDQPLTGAGLICHEYQASTPSTLESGNGSAAGSPSTMTLSGCMLLAYSIIVGDRSTLVMVRSLVK